MNIHLTDEQFRALWGLYPDDEGFREAACREAAYGIRVPNRTGWWPRHNARVYDDQGFMGSGYLLVDTRDHLSVPECLSNGYVPSGIPFRDIVWDDQPKREHLLEIRQLLHKWGSR